MNTIVCRYLSKLFVAYMSAIHQQKAVGECNMPLFFIMRYEICGGVERRRTDSVPVFCGSPLGAMEILVFWPKNLEDSTVGGAPWQYHRGVQGACT